MSPPLRYLAVCCLLAAIFCPATPARAGEIVISGIYQGKNLFVQNPLSPDQKTYCADQVFVNDKKTISSIRLAAFEVDLSEMEINEPVTIRITHKEGCAPRLINPQVIRPSAGFQLEEPLVSLDRVTWRVADEATAFVYYVESLRNGNWIVLERQAARATGKSEYTVPIVHPGGPSRYRIRAQNTETHQVYYSRTITFDPDSVPPPPPPVEPPVAFSPASPRDQITLSREAAYEVTDARNKTVLKGRGLKIATKALKAGAYSLKLNDQAPVRFVKK